ncbi:MAG TPA: glycosyltransferase [Mycobacteriales bacterium]|nr:glycosyltransferase [Mycobacteriales bacterium]
MSRVVRLAHIGAFTALGLTAHALVNLRLLRVAPPADGPGRELVTVLLPLRNEASQAQRCIEAVQSALTAHGRAELIIVDDCSTDGTTDVVRAVIAADPRVRLISGERLPTGWLGKSHACQQAADAADDDSTLLVFIDADVELAVDALRRIERLIRGTGLAQVSPYPRQVAETAAERLVQPLLQWSWLTLLPLRVAERSNRPALGAANGQLFAVDASAYRHVGGHGSVRGHVLEDLELLKCLKRHGFHGSVTDGTDLACCRMYHGWSDLREGYAKSLWAAFGSPVGAVMSVSFLATVYLLPPLAWLSRPRDTVAALGTASGIVGRAVVAHRVGGRVWPDSVAHPLSVLALAWLTARSWWLHACGGLTWKGRAL